MIYANQFFTEDIEADPNPQLAWLRLTGGENNASKSQPNKPEHMLKIILCRLNSTEATHKKELLTYVRTLTTQGTSKSLARLVDKAEPLLDIFSKLYNYCQFHSMGVTPDDLVTLHK